MPKISGWTKTYSYTIAEIEPTTILWKKFSAAVLFLIGIYILTIAV